MNKALTQSKLAEMEGANVFTSPSVRFLEEVQKYMEIIKRNEQENIMKAARVMADCIADDRIIHVCGTGGHSPIIAEEALYRKGGLACVNPIYDPTFSLSHGALLAINHLERIYGVTPVLLDYYGVKDKNDVFVFGTAWGCSPQSVDLAMEVKKRGLTLIAIACKSVGDYTLRDHPSRHSSGLVVAEVADICIDNHAPNGDACIEIEGFDKKVSPISTIIQLSIYESLVAEVCNMLVKRGIEPPIWTNALSEGGVERNEKYIRKYGARSKSL